jgi:SDR family mycofactocin-dependent oxidoreductase
MTQYPPRFSGKVAFITGAARGQGRAEAVRLAAEGAAIIAVDVCRTAQTTQYPGPTVEDLTETGRLVKEQGGQVVTDVVDVRNYGELKRAVVDGVAQLGALDIVVANAGICSANPLWETTAEQWQETIDVNLTGVFHTLKATIPILIEQGRGGSIIVTSSVAGLRGLPFLSAYVATKHAVVGIVRCLANEVGEHGIRVNSIHPNGVDTGMTVPELFPMIEKRSPSLSSIFSNSIPTPETVQPEDIANAVAWLASDEARYVTGSQIPVDLGTLIR